MRIIIKSGSLRVNCRRRGLKTARGKVVRILATVPDDCEYRLRNSNTQKCVKLSFHFYRNFFIALEIPKEKFDSSIGHALTGIAYTGPEEFKF